MYHAIVFLPLLGFLIAGPVGKPERDSLGGADQGRVGLEEYPLIADRPMLNGLSTAYVCENYVCNLPVTSTENLAKQLNN